MINKFILNVVLLLLIIFSIAYLLNFLSSEHKVKFSTKADSIKLIEFKLDSLSKQNKLYLDSLRLNKNDFFKCQVYFSKIDLINVEREVYNKQWYQLLNELK